MGLVSNNWATQPWCQYAWSVPTAFVAVHTQIQIVSPGTNTSHVQIDIVAYNITQFRVLWQIASDGTVSGNYTSSSDQSADKAVINLKSDIIEKYWQATGKTSEWVQFDAGAGKTISMDTFALIGHNLTTSAVVKIYGQGDGSAVTPVSWAITAYAGPLTMPEDPNQTNLIWIAPTLPQVAYRYWRVTIEDPTNTASIKVGRLVAGASMIFNGENALQQVELTEVPYQDEMKLNGFTTISNNRALKNLLTFHFKDLNRISLANYNALKKYTRYCRTSLKALVILDPSAEASKYTFTAFSKLQTAPKETHNFVDQASSYTMLDLTYDEGR